MGLATSTVKYILFVFNLLCALIGIAIVALGGVLLSNLKSLKDFGEQVKTFSLPVAIIVLGCFIFIIAFFGCCGAIRESHCMTITYSVFLFVLLVLQIIAVVLLFVSQETIRNEIRHAIDSMWENTRRNPDTMSGIEQLFKCCGRDGPMDYLPSQPPASCCPNPEQGGCTLSLNFFKNGCKEVVTDNVTKWNKMLAYVGLGVFGIELVGFIFACCLANHIRNHKRRSTY